MPAWCSSRTSSPASRSAPTRAPSTAQKCVRAGGKHNDLDNVGYTARHHTFFEMLGNFSFGDYFKERAIELAWNLVTKEFGLPKDKLTGHGLSSTTTRPSISGRRSPGCPTSAIIRIAGSRQFLGDGRHRPVRPVLGNLLRPRRRHPGRPAGHRRTRTATASSRSGTSCSCSSSSCRGGKRVDLPKPSIDTGMGLERIAAVLQGTHDNYDIDLFRALIGAVADADRRRSPTGRRRPSHRVIADHLRASSFLIADGVLPSNEGRGYVLRRIMRRAMRHAAAARRARAADVAAGAGAGRARWARPIPSCVRAEALITETLKLEETRFRKTLERGLRSSTRRPRRSSRATMLDGETAFKLYDTYGFPLDLTQDALRARGIGVDIDGFNAAMEQQREKARAAWAGSGEAATEAVWFALREKRRRHRVPRLRDRERRRRRRRAGARRQGGRRAQGRRERRRRRSTRRRSTASPAARSATPAR